MFRYFLTPSRTQFWVIILATAVVVFAGRFFLIDGSVWTSLGIGLAAVAILFPALNYRAMRHLDVPAAKWVRDGIGASISASALVALAGTSSAVIQQTRSVYYADFDSYLQYIPSPTWDVLDRTQNVGSVTATFVVIFLLAVAACLLIGMGAGAAKGRPWLLGIVLVGAVFTVVVVPAAASLLTKTTLWPPAHAMLAAAAGLIPAVVATWLVLHQAKRQ